MSKSANHAAVLARALDITQDSAGTKEFVYLPAGEHEIYATVGGKPEKVTVRVDASVAGRLHADLTRRLAGNVQPFIDYDHSRARSAGRPKAFHWDTDKGVICQVEWTQAATAAIRDGEYSYFSPEFAYDRANQTVKGLLATGPVGGLVNDPAFQAMPAIAAARADHFPDPQHADDGPSPNQHHNSNMNEKIVAALIAANIISATEAGADAAPQLIIARFNARQREGEESVKAAHATVLKERDDRIKELEESVKATKAELDTRKGREADDAVKAAVQAGRIAPKDQGTQDWWKAAILSGGENSVKALNAMPVNPALKPTSASSTEHPPEKDKAEKLSASSAEFEAMSERERMDFAVKGGRISD